MCPQIPLKAPSTRCVDLKAVTIGVVIPTLNEAKCVSQAISTSQVAGADEIIVVDGGSHDATVEISHAAGTQVIRTNPSRAIQQNTGATLAKSDVLLFLHADCWLEPQAIGQIREAFADSRVHWAAFQQAIDAGGRIYRLLEWGNARRARRGIPYGDQGICVRRSTFLARGGFPEVSLMEDRLLAQAWRRTTRALVLPGPLHVSPRRWQKYGVIRQTLRNWTLISAVQLGISPDRLSRFYRANSTQSGE